MKKAYTILICLLLGAAALSGCGRSASDRAGNAAPIPAETEAIEADAPAVAEIEFTDGAVNVAGAAAEGGEIVLDRGGVYRITGTSSSARVVVAAADNQDVTLILAGCDLSWADDEVIYVKSARSAAIVLEDGTENRLTSGIPPASGEDLPQADEDASGAALRAKCPMTLTGGGALTVCGYINNGVASSDNITIDSGGIAVTAVSDGVKSKADILIVGGSLTIVSAMDGVQADGSLTIAGGDLDIVTDGGADGASMKASDSSMMGAGPGGGRPGGSREVSGESNGANASQEREPGTAGNAGGAESAENTLSRSGSREMPSPGMGWDADDGDSGSHKGLKSDGDITISGGTIVLDAADDAIHSGGAVIIEGGRIEARSGDDGVHGDVSLLIAGGSVDIRYCYEGLEAPAIDITDGYVNIVATDDGMNVNGGSFGGPGQGSGDPSGEPPVLRITGGLVLVDSGGDGLDSNGSIYIEGGEIYVSGPSTNWDAAIDYGEGSSELIITGGTLMAAGYSGMAEAPDSADGAQGSIYYTQTEYVPDGSAVTLTDQNGNVIVSHSFAHSFNCVVISSPLISEGASYTLTMGDTEATIEMTSRNYSNRAARGGPGGGSREPNRGASGEASAGTGE